MSKKIVLFLVLTTLLSCSLHIDFNRAKVNASNGYRVHNLDTGLNYTTIQEAIDAPETIDGHTITVDAGIYDVNAFVNKSVSVVGESRETTILRASVSHEFIGIFIVYADNVTIAGFTVQNGYWGIHLYGNYAHIANCAIRNNTSGIVSGPRYGALGGNTIEGSIIEDNGIIGIDLMTGNNRIYNNIISGNGKVGINVVYTWNKTSGTVIYENIIENNQIGCQIGGSYNNVVFHNNFLNNTVQAPSPTGDINEWDDEYPSGGNFWSDYNGTDLFSGPGQNETGSDGIGDKEYVIDGNNTDNYPLMGLFSDFKATSEYHVQTICNSSISDFQFNGTAIMFNVTGVEGTAGFCRICVPTGLMNATYRVFVNGTEVISNLLPCSNSTYSYLYFNYTHSTQEVIIIPEFSSFLILPLFLLATLLAVIVYRRRHCQTD